MSIITLQIKEQKSKLEAKLALISGNNLAAHITERKRYEAKIAEAYAKIRHICLELGLGVWARRKLMRERRTLMNDRVIARKVIEVLNRSIGA